MIVALLQVPAHVLPDFRFYTLTGQAVTAVPLPALFVFVDPDCEHFQRAVHYLDTQYSALRKVTVCIVSMAGSDEIKHFAWRYAPRLKSMWLRDTGNVFISRFHPVRYPSLFLYSGDKRLLDYEDNEETVFRIIRAVGH